MATNTPRFGLRKPASSDLVNVTSDLSDNFDKIDAFFPAGMMVAYGGTASPTGWLLCDGAAVSRATYAGLFTVLGVRYGVGDGSTTFNLPDLRNRVPLGQNLPADAVSIISVGAHAHNTPTAAKNTGAGTNHVHSTNNGSVDHNHTFSGTTGGFSANHIHGGIVRGTDVTDGGNVDHTHGYSGTVANGGSAHTHTVNGEAGHTHSFTVDIPSNSNVPVQTVNYIVKT